MGDSAGGGLSAAVCLLARDRGGPAIALQLLIYPMLDDRTTLPDPELAPTAIWSYDDITGWQAFFRANGARYQRRSGRGGRLPRIHRNRRYDGQRSRNGRGLGGSRVMAREVAVDVASHSPQVDPILDELYDVLAEIEPLTPEIPYYSVDPIEVGEDDLALMQLTSGSTGSPKAVQITHRNIYSNAEAMFMAPSMTSTRTSWSAGCPASTTWAWWASSPSRCSSVRSWSRSRRNHRAPPALAGRRRPPPLGLASQWPPACGRMPPTPEHRDGPTRHHPGDQTVRQIVSGLPTLDTHRCQQHRIRRHRRGRKAMGPRYRVPGLTSKAMSVASGYAPRAIVAPIVGAFYKKLGGG